MCHIFAVLQIKNHSRETWHLFFSSWLPHFLPSNHISCASPPHTLVIHDGPLVVLETSPVDHDPQSILHGDLLTLLMVLSCSSKHFPLFYSNERSCREGQHVDQCTNLTISPQLQMCQTLCRGEIRLAQKPSVFPLSRLPRLWDAWWKSIITLGSEAGTSTPRLWLASCWHPKGWTRW